MEVRGRDALFVWSLRTLTLTPIIAPLWVPVPFPAFILLNGCMFYAEICPKKRVSDLRKECCNCDEGTLDESQEAGHEWAVDNHAGAGYMRLFGVRVALRHCRFLLLRRVQYSLGEYVPLQ